MHTVGIKALKNRLSEFVRLAATGEAVLVTDRGQVVAELIAPRVHADATQTEQRLGQLMRQGLLTPPSAAPAAPLPVRKPVAPLAEVLQQLDASRAER